MALPREASGRRGRRARVVLIRRLVVALGEGTPECWGCKVARATRKGEELFEHLMAAESALHAIEKSL